MVHTQKPANCLSMFDHFVGLALKELTNESEDLIKNVNNPKSKKEIGMQKLSETKVYFNSEEGLCQKEEFRYNHPKEICKFYFKSGY